MRSRPGAAAITEPRSPAAAAGVAARLPLPRGQRQPSPHRRAAVLRGASISSGRPLGRPCCPAAGPSAEWRACKRPHRAFAGPDGSRRGAEMQLRWGRWVPGMGLAAPPPSGRGTAAGSGWLGFPWAGKQAAPAAGLGVALWCCGVAQQQLGGQCSARAWSLTVAAGVPRRDALARPAVAGKGSPLH